MGIHFGGVPSLSWSRLGHGEYWRGCRRIGEEVHQVTCVRGKEGKVTSSKDIRFRKACRSAWRIWRNNSEETADVVLYTARIPWAGARNSWSVPIQLVHPPKPCKIISSTFMVSIHYTSLSQLRLNAIQARADLAPNVNQLLTPSNVKMHWSDMIMSHYSDFK